MANPTPTYVRFSQPKLVKLMCTSVILLTAAACAPLAKTPDHKHVEQRLETSLLNEWLDEQFEEQLAFSPTWQTSLGRKTNYDKIGDFSAAAAQQRLDWQRASVETMQTQFSYDKLTADGKISYDLWAYQLKTAEAANTYRNSWYMFTQLWGVHTGLPRFMTAQHSVDNEADMIAYIARLHAIPLALDQTVARAKNNAELGSRPPRFAYDGVIDSSRKIISGMPFTDGEDSAIWADAQNKINSLEESGEIDGTRAASLRREAQATLVKDWQPAYEALIAWHVTDRENASINSHGVDVLPNGAAYYNQQLASNTTTSLTSDEVYQIGIDEVARLRAEMETIKDEINFDGDLKAFFNMLRESKDDPRHYYPNTDEGRQSYLDDSAAAIANVETEIPDFFGLLPKAELEIRRVEAYREQPGAAQHYYRGAPDGSRPGIYYVHLSDMTAMPKGDMETTAYHEGLPGHHMQLSIQQELKDIPVFRTQTGFTAYTEGWGLYAEFLAKEMDGTFTDPYSDFGRLNGEIWRAVRLVVDTGLHSRGWTEDQAIAYFQENTSLGETQIRSEVRRYLVQPGQATSYKIGMLKILELRQKAQTALGDQFDIKGFHDTILGGGAVPLVLLEQIVDRWIASQN